MKVLSFKIPIVLYEQIKTHANSRGITVSELARMQLTDVYEGNPETDGGKSEIDDRLTNVSEANAVLKAQVAGLESELVIKNEQISELHQLLAIQSKTTGQLTEQLEAVKELEDMRQRRSWWGRLFHK